MERRLEIDNGRGRMLAARVHRPGGWSDGGPAAIICHGMLSSKDSPKHVGLAEGLAKRGILAMRLDFTGRGESEGSLGELTVGGQVRDLAAAVARVGQMGAGRLGLVGSSLGGTVVVLYAGRRGGVDALAALAPASRPGELLVDRMDPGEVARWERTGELPTEAGPLSWEFVEDARSQDVLDAARVIGCPAMLIHGARDDVVPRDSSLSIFESLEADGELIVVENGDHRFSDPEHLALVTERVISWLSRHLGAR
jgi:alpha-beta hydrolase superfamily lysophospholipase